LNYS